MFLKVHFSWVTNKLENRIYILVHHYMLSSSEYWAKSVLFIQWVTRAEMCYEINFYLVQKNKNNVFVAKISLYIDLYLKVKLFSVFGIPCKIENCISPMSTRLDVFNADLRDHKYRNPWLIFESVGFVYRTPKIPLLIELEKNLLISLISLASGCWLLKPLLCHNITLCYIITSLINFEP